MESSGCSAAPSTNAIPSVRLLQYRHTEGPTGPHSTILTLSSCSASSLSHDDENDTWVVVQQASKYQVSDDNNNKDDENSNNKSRSSTKQSGLSWMMIRNSFQQHILVHFLPARYPTSVAAGYSKFCSYTFAASVAGSAAMVLSTQTLLLAVGVVGSSSASISGGDTVTTTTTDSSSTAAAAATAPVMAGALNWVLKDGMGQLGGVLFASQMGRTRRFDDNPKQWRLVSAVCLDVANLMDITAPWLLVAATATTTTGAVWWNNPVLPWACISNVMKNIGFLTASASRAALHQSLARTTTATTTSNGEAGGGGSSGGNLADVTAKAGTQAMAAGLLGTALGIALSAEILGGGDTNSFVLGFCLLSFIHQGCTYQSLHHVHLHYFNHNRLDILLRHYVQNNGHVLSPAQVAEKENYLPSFFSLGRRPRQSCRRGEEKDVGDNDSASWLRIGSPIQTLAPYGLAEWQQLVSQYPSKQYVLRSSSSTGITVAGKEMVGDDGQRNIHVTFLDTATGHDLILGMLHAHLLRHRYRSCHCGGDYCENNNNDEQLQQETYEMLQATQESFFQELSRLGWTTETNMTHVEPSNAVRIQILL